VKLLSALATIAVVAGLSACNPQVAPAISPEVQVPSDSAAVCAYHCRGIGLELAAVVLVRDRIGCVCAPPAATPPAGPPGASVGGAGAATAISMVIDDEEAAAAARRRAAQQQQRK